MPDNMRIWDQVEKTDPAHTKQFNNGTFRGTSIGAMYNVRRATKLFGPIGTGWGFDVGAPEYVTDPESNAIIVQVRVAVWYMDDAKRREAIQYGATKMMYTTKDTKRRIVDEDAVKKAITDGLSKALSLLGFSADVHLGKHDDPAYVRSLRNGGLDDDGPPPTEPAPKKGKAEQIRASAAAIVLDINGLADLAPASWTAEHRALLSESVKLICGKANIPIHESLREIPDAETPAFAAAAAAERGKR